MILKKLLALTFCLLLVALTIKLDLNLLSQSEPLRRLLLQRLQELLGEGVVFQSQRSDPSGSIILRDVTLRGPEGAAAGSPLMQAERVEIVNEIHPLFLGGIRPTRVEVFSPQLILERQEDGRWNFEAFRDSLPEWEPSEEPPPVLLIHDGTLIIKKAGFLKEGTAYRFRKVEAQVSPLSSSRLLVEGRLSTDELGVWDAQLETDLSKGGTRLRLETRELALRPDLGDLFSPDIAQAWHNYDPLGCAEVAIHYEQRAGEEDSFFRARVRLKGITARYIGFPYRLDKVWGQVEFRTDGATITRLEGEHGPARVALWGEVVEYGSDAGVDLFVRMENGRLEEDLRAAFQPESQRAWDLFHPTGPFRVYCRLIREYGPDKPLDNHMDVYFEGVDCEFVSFPYPVRGLRGFAEIENDAIRIHGLTFQDDRANWIVTGSVDALTTEGETGFAVTVHGMNVPLDDRLYCALDDSLKKVWEDFSPDGQVHLSWNVKREVGPDQEVHHDLQLEPQGMTATYSQLPYTLHDVGGRFCYTTADGGRVDIAHLVGRHGDSVLELRGSVETEGEEKLHLELVGRNMTLDDELSACVPEELGSVLESLSPCGTMNLQLTLDRYLEQKEKAVTDYIAVLRLDGVSMTGGLDFKDVYGEASLRGRIREEVHEADGSLALSEVTVEGKRFTRVNAGFIVQEDGELVFQDIGGRCYGGMVGGTFGINLDRQNYFGTFQVANVDIAQYAVDTFVAGKKLSGTLRGNVQFMGNGSRENSFQGEGNILVHNGDLWELPLFLNMLNFLRIDPGAGDSFEEGRVRFELEANRMKVKSMEFKSDSSKITGRGYVYYDGEISLYINSEFRGTLVPIIPGVDDLLTKLKESIYNVKARGTFRDPEFKLNPFPIFGDDFDDED